MRKIIFMLMLVLLIGSAYAVNETNSTNQTEVNNSVVIEEISLCDYIMEKANIPVGTAMPKVLHYKNEIFNIYTTENESVGHLTIVDGIVNEYECVLVEQPTNNVFLAGKQTIDDILDSEKQVDALVGKINNDEIKIKGLTTRKKIKNFFAITGLRITSLFV